MTYKLKTMICATSWLWLCSRLPVSQSPATQAHEREDNRFAEIELCAGTLVLGDQQYPAAGLETSQFSIINVNEPR